MATIPIKAILWRKYLSATSHAVWAVSSSQYYFELTGTYEGFFDGAARAYEDKDKNQAFAVTLEPFDGTPACGPHEVIFTKKRANAAREGRWTVDSIRDGAKKAYDLWRRERGPLMQYVDLPEPEKERNFIVIVRDVDRRFHGRWIRGTDFDALPRAIQDLLLSGNCGWRDL